MSKGLTTIDAERAKKATLGASGGFIKPGSTNFDLIINILVGIRRSLANLVEIPSMVLDPY